MQRIWIIAAIIFVLDRATKYMIVEWMNLKTLGQIDVLPPFINLRMAWNYGINFGIGASDADWMRWLLIAVAIAICTGVVIWLRHAEGWLIQLSAGLLVGGAIGNVWDRVQYGAVADFLNMSCCGIANPFAFNIADVAIFAGAIGLMLFTGKDAKAG